MLQFCRDIVGNEFRPGLNEVLAHHDVKRGCKQPDLQNLQVLARATGNDRCCAARVSGNGAAVSCVARALRLTSLMSSKSGRDDRAVSRSSTCGNVANLDDRSVGAHGID